MKPTARQIVALLIVLLGVIFFVVRGYHDEHEALRLRDFKQPYASARCLLEGCNPYSDVDTLRAYQQADGPNDDYKVIEPYSALYPPFSFALLTPIGALPFPVAAKVWMALLAALFSLATLLIARTCLPYAPLVSALLLCFFTATSTILLMLGQVSGPVIGLLGIGIWCLLCRKSTAPAVLCLSLAVLLKPHDAAFLIFYLLFAGRSWRRVFARTVILSCVLAAAGTLWCALQPASAHWLRDWRANLAGNSTPASVNDPGRGFYEATNLGDLEALVAPVLPEPSVYKAVAYTASATLLALWMVPAVRMRNCQAKHFLGLAFMAVFTLLPIYHRQYDTRIFILLLPAIAWLLAWRPRSWGLGAVAIFLAGTLLTSHQYLHLLTAKHLGSLAHAGGLETVLIFRPLPLIELVIACFFLAAFWTVYRVSERDAGEQSIPAKLLGEEL